MNPRKRLGFAMLMVVLAAGILVLAGCTRIPAAPEDLYAMPGDGVATLHWTAIDQATEYGIFKSTESGGPYTAVDNTTNEGSYQVTGLTNGTRYYFVITAGNSAGWSAYSNETSAVPNPPPPAPTGLSAAPGNGKVTLSWNASTGASSYAIYGSTTSGGGYGYKTSVEGLTTCEVTGLTNGTTYYFVVTAGNGNGWSGYSNEASAKPTGTAFAGLPSMNIGALLWAGTPQASHTPVRG